MSQTYTDNVYATDHAVQTDMQNVENNFAALKSAFSGATTPANTVAGMWWFDTTANILKLRNEANNAWLSVWDFANNRALAAASAVNADNADAVGSVALTGLVQIARQIIAGTGLSGGGSLAANRTITHAAHTGDVTGATTLTIGAAKVSQSKLKTSTGSVSVSVYKSLTATSLALTLPGGEYGFYPRIRGDNNSTHGSTSKAIAQISNVVVAAGADTGYITRIYLTVQNIDNTISDAYYYTYANQRYVTSSGEVFWIFILRDKVTKRIVGMYQAPDHPCFGNGGKPLLVSHPFGSYDPETQEIIVINPSHEEVEAMKKKGERGEDEPDKDLLEVIMEEYEIDEDSKPVWPTIPVTVGLPKDYESKGMGENIAPIKKVIPKMAHLQARTLRKKRQR